VNTIEPTSPASPLSPSDVVRPRRSASRSEPAARSMPVTIWRTIRATRKPMPNTTTAPTRLRQEAHDARHHHVDRLQQPLQLQRLQQPRQRKQPHHPDADIGQHLREARRLQPLVQPGPATHAPDRRPGQAGSPPRPTAPSPPHPAPWPHTAPDHSPQKSSHPTGPFLHPQPRSITHQSHATHQTSNIGSHVHVHCITVQFHQFAPRRCLALAHQLGQRRRRGRHAQHAAVHPPSAGACPD